eukprot:scaffold398135_cov55-Attheya_sp.AAC.3
MDIKVFSAISPFPDPTSKAHCGAYALCHRVVSPLLRICFDLFLCVTDFPLRAPLESRALQKYHENLFGIHTSTGNTRGFLQVRTLASDTGISSGLDLKRCGWISRCGHYWNCGACTGMYPEKIQPPAIWYFCNARDSNGACNGKSTRNVSNPVPVCIPKRFSWYFCNARDSNGSEEIAVV